MWAHRNAIAISLTVAMLLGIGITMLTSTSMWIDGVARYAYLTKQSIWMVVGLVFAWILASVDYRFFRRNKPVLYGAFLFSLFLLVLLYIPGVGLTIKGETRWLSLPGIGTFQPSEFAKITTLMALAAWYAHYQAETKKFIQGFTIPCMILAIPVALIFFEKDMGTAAALGAAGLAVVYIAGSRMLYIIPSIIAALGGFCWFVYNNENRYNRIMAFLHPDENKSGFFYQQYRGLLAFGNGGMEGVGLGNGAEKHGYLPLAETDFIFPVIGEELGWVTLLVVLCFVSYAVFGLLIAMKARDTFGRLLAIGLTTVIVIPAMMNMGVTTAVLPNTGLPLPFISYGGSNLVVTIMSVGLLLSIHRESGVKRPQDLIKVKEQIVDARI